jgi:hypothetical protein
MQGLWRNFAINKVLGTKGEWLDKSNAEKTKRPEYIVPEERKARIKKADEEFVAEDFKEKLLGARHFKIEPKVEEDIIFGTNLPNLLELSKLNNVEMFLNVKSLDFDYHMKL